MTEDGELSLYELSQWLGDQPERFATACNLDGGPSTGVSIEDGDHDVDVPSVDVPNVITILDRSLE